MDIDLNSLDLNSLDLNTLITQFEEQYAPQLASLLAVLGIALLIAGVFMLIGYILRSLAFARMGHRRNIPWWGLAWVPGLRLITIGQLADYHDRKTIRAKHRFSILLPVLFFLGLIAGILEASLFSTQIKTALASISSSPEATLTALFSQSHAFLYTALSLISTLSWTLFSAFYLIAIYKVLEACKWHLTILNMILYLIVPFAAPIVLIAISGSDSDRKRHHHHHHHEAKAADDDQIEVETEEE